MILSVIIPSLNEVYLQQTIDDVLKNCETEIEVVVVLDGYWPPPGYNWLDKRIKILHLGKTGGMRNAINSGVAIANGKYILKLDGHCMVDKGFDTKLIEAHQDNWVQVPRRKRLDAEHWKIIEDGRPDIDYMTFDKDNRGRVNDEMNKDPERAKKLIDDLEAFQGSGYFISRDYFHKLGLLDDMNFGGSGAESLEIVLKCRHDGGRVVVNKNTWYAHYHKKEWGYPRDHAAVQKSRDYTPKFIEQYGTRENKSILSIYS